ncbi:MAG: hypothetical protein Q8Q62_19330 [Mesorhizobium sp.]|nr:hypothetical protein [Mesorhizobium sp.]
MLDGIVLLLLALAGLAERAAGRSLPVRWLVLWSLWHAHDVARDFVAGFPWSVAGRSPALAAAAVGDDPAGAMHLASSLRALARMVRTMAARARLSILQRGAASGRSRDGEQAARLDALVAALRKAVFSPVQLHDTS